MLVLDAHVHCGLTLPLEKVLPRWRKGNIDGGVVFSPVEEIYDRYDSNFVDSPFYRQSRKRVHAYLESILAEKIYAFWFVWNDFELPGERFRGVKWHRHPCEPRYNYESEECERFIEHICSRKLPIILEEEFHHTLYFIERFNGRSPVIIPHLGALNGGYRKLKEAGIFEYPSVYADMALAGVQEIADFAETYGTERLLFGSDFPFGDPPQERAKVERLFTGEDLQRVFSKNLLHLLSMFC